MLDTQEVVRIRSYKSDRQAVADGITVGEAARATSAATTFFEPATVGYAGIKFADGALGWNNPVGAVWTEAKDIWSPDKDNLGDLVKCIVSIGTGIHSTKAIEENALALLSKTLLSITTETERTAEAFHRDHSELARSERYFRFNVSRGLQDVGLAESRKVKEIIAATSGYMQSQEHFESVSSCSRNLGSKECALMKPQLSPCTDDHVSLGGISRIAHATVAPKGSGRGVGARIRRMLVIPLRHGSAR
jgi:hypothetical protein